MAVLEDSLAEVTDKYVKIKSIEEVQEKSALIGNKVTVDKEQFSDIKTLDSKQIVS